MAMVFSICREMRELTNVAATVEISVAQVDGSMPRVEFCEAPVSDSQAQ
jgi:hypothetical protein